MKEELLTAADVAGYCQVDLKTIHNWVDKGMIVHFRTPGRHLRFRRPDVVVFLKKYGYPIPDDLKDVTDDAPPLAPPEPYLLPVFTRYEVEALSYFEPYEGRPSLRYDRKTVPRLTELGLIEVEPQERKHCRTTEKGNKILAAWRAAGWLAPAKVNA